MIAVLNSAGFLKAIFIKNSLSEFIIIYHKNQLKKSDLDVLFKSL